MARNGSGTYTLPAGNPVVTGTTISSTWANNTLSDISTALTGSIAKDGQTTPTGNLPMGGFAHTGVADATVRTQYASVAQVQDGTPQYLTSVAGTNVITATASLGMTAYATGQTFRFIAAASCTDVVTLNINAIGAKSITKNGTTALSAGDIATNGAYEVIYDGTRFQLVNPTSVSTFSAGTTGFTPSTATSGAVTLAGKLAEANGGTGTTTGYYGFKNRIINGAMMIDQRNAGASVTPTSGQYTIDRWKGTLTQASKYSIQQNAASVTSPVGFINYLGITSLSAYSIVAGDSFSVNQVIEGLNVSDLGWGTANAQTVTLSFWVRSSLTGTFGGALRNSAQNRSYPFSYTVSSANTWEQKSVPIAGDTTGTWLTNNGIGIELSFGLGVGSTFSNTAGAWAAGNFTSATGATSVVGTNGATFYITGVQLEKGTTATSFDYRPYGTELALCQRYAYTTSGGCSNAGAAASTTEVQQRFNFPVVMRASPTTSITTSGSFGISDDYNADATATTVTITQTRTSTIMGRLTLGGFTGLTTARLYGGVGDTGTAQITFSSEL
jgi:hypothetical protein